MFVSPAYAQAADGAAQGGGFVAIIPLVLIFVVFYFLIIRPQSQKMKNHKEVLAAIRRGDTVVTGGGIMGKISKVIDDATLQVEIAEGVKVKVKREHIATVVSKTVPVQGGGAKDEGKPKPAAGTTAVGGAGARLKGLLKGSNDK